MAKRDIIKAVAKKYGIPQEYIHQILVAILETLPDILQEKGKICIKGFGTLYIKELPERKRRSPFNNETIFLSAQTIVKFKPAKALLKKMNQKDNERT